MRELQAIRFVTLSVLLCAAVCVRAQTEADGHLRVSQSPIQQRAANVRFKGRQLKRESVSVDGPKIVYDGVAYYYSDDDADGMVAEDLKSRTLTIYEPSRLAVAAGWLKPKPLGKEPDKDEEEKPRDYIRGYARSGDVIWMGTDYFGVLAFDMKQKVWARYDFENAPATGRRSFHIFYADEDYVFAGGFYAYSNRHKRWIKIDGIPTRYVRSFGYSGPMVQAPWSLTQYAKEKYLPLNKYPEYLALWVPEKVTLRDDGEAYIFWFRPEDAPTEFTIEKWQLEWAFSQTELNSPPQ
jgi:hypothetical protein